MSWGKRRKEVTNCYNRVKGGSVAFDKIAIKGGTPLDVRGATLPYEEIEAESASYQGTLIGPDRKYLDNFLPYSPSIYYITLSALTSSIHISHFALVNTWYTTLPSEASNREAVQLTAAGNPLSFFSSLRE